MFGCFLFLAFLTYKFLFSPPHEFKTEFLYCQKYLISVDSKLRKIFLRNQLYNRIKNGAAWVMGDHREASSAFLEQKRKVGAT